MLQKAFTFIHRDPEIQGLQTTYFALEFNGRGGIFCISESEMYSKTHRQISDACVVVVVVVVVVAEILTIMVALTVKSSN